MSTLKTQLQEDTKQAMRDKDKVRLGTLRLISAAIKQKEVDERIELDDAAVIAVLDKMLKQRRESITQFEQAGRDDLVSQEQGEVDVINAYMPQQLTADEITALIEAAVASSGAESMRDMGKVMGVLKPQISGRADGKLVSDLVKKRLA